MSGSEPRWALFGAMPRHGWLEPQPLGDFGILSMGILPKVLGIEPTPVFGGIQCSRD